MALSGEDYQDKFSASDYLQRYYSDLSNHHFISLDFYHDVFQSLPNGLRILDYGTGPSVLTTISAAPKASEIILSDFADVNHKALWQWLKRDPDAFDWSPYFSRDICRAPAGALQISHKIRLLRKAMTKSMMS